MQQRLSVARVLLHDPKVLLMDEPASGLDPRARIEMRELLKELRRMGKTIVISSHILHELAELCNVVGVIERGNLLFSGTVKDILRRARLEHQVTVSVAERTEDAAKLLHQVPGVKRVSMAEEDAVIGGFGAVTTAGGGIARRPVIQLAFEETALHSVSDIPNRLVNAGFRLTQFTEEKINLETAFMRLTQGLVQ
jgi:ABC-2 type transport system ATP-binding protein